jgi:hypothetical protein
MSSLRAEALRVRVAAYAATMKEAYKSQLNCYLKFCFNFGFLPVPAGQETLRLYVAFLARTLSPGSISGYLNVVRLIHLEGCFVNPLAGN